ncbi:hypothetical protein AB0C10_17050 [Microbispora amethystogenes]|uniref:hypothetical protein n=1 Tax=Microbispora amethystogenes TaxID=1427754 RepID=UPI0033C3D774
MPSFALWIISLLVAANLLITLALVRRVRDIELARTSHSAPGADLPEAGDVIGAFSATTTDGGTVSRETLADGSSLVVFLLPGCGPCQSVIDALANTPQGPERLVVFVLGSTTDNEVHKVLNVLPSYATTAVIEPGEHSALAATKVGAFPAILTISDGVVTAAYNRMMPRKATVPSEN